MGLGDNLMATGMARGAAARGKRIAFGRGRQILWDHHSETVFRGNPNIAAPGSETAADLEWVPFYKGHRIYNRREGERWIWNHGFRPIPGEVFFTDEERAFAEQQGENFVLIEPGVPRQKSVAPNKQWPVARYQAAATALQQAGIEVRQFEYPSSAALPGVRSIRTKSFRRALAVLARAALYLGPEGGLHHGAAAVRIPAVVLFGGFIPPAVTGYATHINLTGGADACGSLNPCRHCAAAMAAIPVEQVVDACLQKLGRS
jgi:ADP-heptose:LPS heptosyltransferase